MSSVSMGIHALLQSYDTLPTEIISSPGPQTAIHMWTSTNGQFVQTFGPIGSEGDPGTIASDQGIAVSDFTVSSDGEYVAVSHVLDFIALYKVTSDRAYIRTYKFPEITAYSAIQYSRDGRRLFVGGRLIMKSKAGILVLDASDPKDVKCTKIKCMSEDVTCIALSPGRLPGRGVRVWCSAAL